MTTSKPLPYHLRAPRLRWASLAIDLDKSEVLALKQLADESHYSSQERQRSRLLLGLHYRTPIQELADSLDMDRRTLFRLATELIEMRNRRRRRVATSWDMAA